ncbi:MAG: TolC family protein [Thermodesulfobacteriota bacterium]|nr:TolC family protein [Thermodesulfobacteriota bacterium]
MVKYVMRLAFFCFAWAGIVFLTGCTTPESHRMYIDKTAYSSISDNYKNHLGRTDPFTIERPSRILRRQLLEDAGLPVAGPASFGTDKLNPAEHWPEPGYPLSPEKPDSLADHSADATPEHDADDRAGQSGGETTDRPADDIPGHHAADRAAPPAEDTAKSLAADSKEALRLSLVKALEVGACNNSEFQTQKEKVFQAALSLYLEQENFRHHFLGQFKQLASIDGASDPSLGGVVTSASGSDSRLFQNGMSLTTALAVDLAHLLTAGSSSSLGISADTSISIPLLRGSGTHIVAEPLKQAERNLVYAILEFERFKKKFAVSMASSYLIILKALDTVENTAEDYRSRAVSARRSKRLADAGRLKEIEVDQAVQNELIARQRWVSARTRHKKQMDEFKILLGLPPDVNVSLDPDELKRLEKRPAMKAVHKKILADNGSSSPDQNLPADAPVALPRPDTESAGPFELDRFKTVQLALDNRLDMREALGQVADAQRSVVVAADALGAELSLFGTASIGESRNLTGADLANARLHLDKGSTSSFLTLNLPIDRRTEAAEYRNQFIKLEQAVRAVQDLEDAIKLDVQNRLRELEEARETLYIQTKAVFLAMKRVKSITLFMEAGRAETRDLLEAQDALLSAQNDLTAARVDYRVSELEIQRDMGLLTVTDTGLWQPVSLERIQ